ncbi:hypothetical protein TYRP_012636 [Tyrophagus putrescentiae]|nr:hypothetical protein TYRP_012636 [Tyrophagus putrescentiae]
MPPLRPLPDLVLITVFKMLSANDQMIASLISPRCSVLVRAANRTVRTLAIIDLRFPFNPKYIKYNVNSMSLASKPAMQSLMDIPGEPSFPHYPMTTVRFNSWNVLHLGQLQLQLNSAATIEQITTVFSALTDLKFITVSQENCALLVALLQHPNWQCQLTNLMVDGACNGITAINGLTALRQLALDWDSDTDLPDLTILAQLKVVALRLYKLRSFLRSLEQYATGNADLQVHLLSNDIEGLLSLSQPLHRRIVYFGRDDLWLALSDATRLCSQFLFLTSLNIGSIQLTEVGPLFTALSQLHQLVRLGLAVNRENYRELPARHPPRSLAQMNSLWALELYLTISSHSDVDWFNLPWTMPNLQTIYIQKFCCRSCKVSLCSFSALNCFHSSLFTLHPGVSMKRFILNSYEESTSAEKLLLQSHAVQTAPSLHTIQLSSRALLLHLRFSEHLCTFGSGVSRAQWQSSLPFLLCSRIASADSVDSLFPNSPFQSDHPNTPEDPMPPLRPLPDLVLITAFKMLTPNDQLLASLTSPRCAVLVRAASRTVKTLPITGQNVESPGVLDDLKDRR